ncbi:CotH kinase family protein [Anatilimnocola floriformis]|uniref:CotH kinase family protein n=1 Tax=Anatilimnocola floriformis TaxID=2948575 RepID=UPI0020C1C85D|nr:CotH kinase family protein [Anatilimnocola floriformis]
MKPVPATAIRFLALCSIFCTAAAITAQQPKTPAGTAGKDDTKKGLPKVTKPVIKRDESDLFFDPARPQIPFLKIELTPENMAKWKAAPRTYTPAVMIENEKNKFDVEVKVKGSAGSTRDIDDKPAITMKIKGKDVKFHAMDKIHLNNSVQDPAFMCEWLCASILKDANYPHTRVTHARVMLNGRDLGIFVLKESFEEEWMKRHFPDLTGSFYEGGFLQDIDQKLVKHSGDPAEDNSDLTGLLNACREPDEKKRWAELEKVLDIDKFLTFMAMELMMCHWDGYSEKHNNYRIYFAPPSKKAIFVPHGMDQMFGDANYSVFHVPDSIVANAVFSRKEWRFAYFERVKQLTPLFSPARLNAKVDALYPRLAAIAKTTSPAAAQQLDEQIRNFKDRVLKRGDGIVQQIRDVQSGK